MSKTIYELYEEVMKSAELQKEFLLSEKNGAIEEFAAAHGCKASATGIQAFIKEKLGESRELSTDEMDLIAGGEGKNTDIVPDPHNHEIINGNG